LRENEKHYRDLVENSLDLTCTHDLNGVLLTVNRAAARTLGYEPSELVNRNLREFLSPEVREEVDGYLVVLREKGASSGFMRLRTKSGETRIWKYTNSVRTEGVEFPVVRGIAHDLTDIFQAQKALREGEERLRIAAEVGRMYAWEWDSATDSIRRSAECAGILGLEAGERGSGKDYFDLIHPDDRAGLWTLSTSLTPKEPTYRTEYRRFRPDGALLWLEESGRGKFDEAGKMVGLVGMTADITERKQVEEALRASEERSRQIVRKSPVAMLVSQGLEPQPEVVKLANDKFTALFGYSTEEVPDIAHWWPLAYPDRAYREAVRAEWQARVREAIKNHCEIVPMEAKVRCKDGSDRHIEFHFTSLGEANLVSFVDLTGHKQAAEALAKLGGRLIEAQEEERTRIGRELHDDVGQRLALVTIELEQLRQASPDLSAEARRRIDALQKKTAELATDVQAISHQLHSSKLEYLGIVMAMRGFCQEFSEQQRVEIVFAHDDIPSTVPREISLCLFRVLQEALQNAIKHSGVRHFDAELRYAPDGIDLTVRDSGAGFDVEQVKKSHGLGLISMAERVKLAGGQFSVDSQLNRGTTIYARVPLGTRNESLRAVV
jgi:PAS domain S-box-containing protein